MTSLKQISGVNLRWQGFFTTWYRCSYLENMHYGQSWSFMNERISSSVFFLLELGKFSVCHTTLIPTSMIIALFMQNCSGGLYILTFKYRELHFYNFDG